jgi:hypothetical protein
MIDVVIPYCTLDEIFIEENIRQCQKFANNIFISVSSHLYNGEPENKESIDNLKSFCSQYKNIDILEYQWHDNIPFDFYWNCYSRWIGIEKCKTDYIMQIDSDEIIDGDLFLNSYRKNFNEFWTSYKSYSLSMYWYFRDFKYRSKTLEQAHMIVARNVLNKRNVFTKYDRGGHAVIDNVTSLFNVKYQDNVYIHHFSWVRTKAQLLKKVSGWGHKNERRWEELIEDSFSRPFLGKDCVHGYEFELVDTPFNFSPLKQ